MSVVEPHFITDSPAIKEILSEFMTFLKQGDPILSQIKFATTLHDGGTHYQRKGAVLDTPLERNRTTIQMKDDVAINYDLDSFVQSIYDLTTGQMESLLKTLFTTVGRITDFTGNKLDVKGLKTPAEIFLAGLKTIPIEFDKDGTPRMPMMVGGNKFKNIEFTAEQERELSEIIEENKKQFYAKKRRRRLSVLGW